MVCAERPHPMKRTLLPLLVLGTSLLTTSSAQDPIVPLQALALDSLAGFRPAEANWVIGGGVAGPMRTETAMEITPGQGVLASPTPVNAGGGNLITSWEHGDLELEFEFLLAKGGNSGAFFQGRYEVQLIDSWLKPPAALTFADLGGVYQRWTDAEGGWDGHAPATNAARAPGLWQQARIKFRAPRFDAAGVKTANARFDYVEINGVRLHENVELSGPTRGTLAEGEAASGPLMLQGAHGPAAYRNIRYKATQPLTLRVDDIRYAWYAGNHRAYGEYEFASDESVVGEAESLDPRMSGESGTGTLLVDATLQAPVAGTYGFRVRGFAGRMQALIDDDVVADTAGEAVGLVDLTPGRHALRLEYIRTFGNGEPIFTVEVEGPGMEPQSLTPPFRGRPQPQAIMLDPEERTLAQRGFVEHGGIMRFDTISIGFPSGIHFAYDLAEGAPLKVWRGRYLDMTDMWQQRGIDQVARSRGDVVELAGLPMLALLQAEDQVWPTGPDPALRERGYTRDAAGVPTFKTQLGPLVITDRLEPLADGAGLRRTVVATGRSMNDDPHFLLAAAPAITLEADDTYVIGDRAYYLTWEGAGVESENDDEPAPPPRPMVREQNGRQELIVRFPNNEAGRKTFAYTLTW